MENQIVSPDFQTLFPGNNGVVYYESIKRWSHDVCPSSTKKMRKKKHYPGHVEYYRSPVGEGNPTESADVLRPTPSCSDDSLLMPNFLCLFRAHAASLLRQYGEAAWQEH